MHTSKENHDRPQNFVDFVAFADLVGIFYSQLRQKLLNLGFITKVFEIFTRFSTNITTVTQDHFYSINETEDHGILYYVYHTILRIAIPCNTTQYNII